MVFETIFESVYLNRKFILIVYYKCTTQRACFWEQDLKLMVAARMKNGVRLEAVMARHTYSCFIIYKAVLFVL